MPFARPWTRGAFGATSATLLVPGALAIGLSAASLGGGLRGLGDLGQVIAGPPISAADRALDVAGAGRPGARLPDAALGRLPSVPRSTAARIAVAPGLRASGPGPSGTPSAPPRPTDGVRPDSTPKTPSESSSSESDVPSVTATTIPQIPPAATRPPDHAVRDVGSAVGATVGTLPAPVGSTGQDAVTTLIDLVAPK